MTYTIRPARTSDVRVIRKLIDANVDSGRLLSKATVTLYEDIQEFVVAELTAPVDGSVSPVDGSGLAGCGAVHVLWEDLAELRTVAVRSDCQGLGIGHGIVAGLIDRSRQLGVARVFVLTFAVDFFGAHGFRPIKGTPVAPDVYQELLRSYDEGVAEFLDLERVKPNTLGNTRMLLHLLPGYAGGEGGGYAIEPRNVSGSADTTAGSLRRGHHRRSAVPATSDGAEGRCPREAPSRRRRVATYQRTSVYLGIGLSQHVG